MGGERSCLSCMDSLFNKYLSSTFCVPGVMLWLESSGSSRLKDGCLPLCSVLRAVKGKGQVPGSAGHRGCPRGHSP